MFHKILLLVFLINTHAQADETKSTPEIKDTTSTEIKIDTYFPLIFYTPETSVAAGLLWLHKLETHHKAKNSNIHSQLVYTANSQWIVDISPQFFSNDLKTEYKSKIVAMHFPQNYYGSNLVRQNSSEKETLDTIDLQQDAIFNIIDDYFFRINGGYRRYNISQYNADGLLAAQINQYGFRNFDVPTLGIGLEWDDRDYPLSPTSGKYLKYFYKYMWVQDYDNKIYKQLAANELDLKFYNSFADKRTLAQQIFFGQASPGNYPNEVLYYLGGGQKLRGYYKTQYVGNSFLLAQIELRTQITDKKGWSVFAGAAQISSTLDNLLTVDTKLAGGGGIFYIIDPQSRLKIKVDLAVSKENSGVYFLAGEAF